MCTDARARAAILLAAAVLLAGPVGGCGGDGGDGAEEAPQQGTTEPPPAQTATETEPAAGRELFVSQASPACGSCHTLADAGTSGTVGPDLDDLRPDAERVERALRSGPGVMPNYESQLNDEQIQQLAEYVSGAASP